VKNYLKIAYSEEEKPKSDYPSLLMRHLFHDLLGVKNGVVVDVGCGTGDQLKSINELGFDVIGLDQEKKQCDDNLDYRQCNIIKNAFPVDDNVANIVFCKSVIEHLHIYQIDHFFSEMKRICKPGGCILISTPDWSYNFRSFYDEFTHCTPFTSRSINHCFQMNGIAQVVTYSLIPLPITWNSAVMRLLANIINFLSPPRKWGKWCRWSQERQLIAYGIVKK
jgi:2-polyprenyl-3-methyl-5-hydroxy-6-metoxy-1,4-benzoquinol methylase